MTKRPKNPRGKTAATLLPQERESTSKLTPNVLGSLTVPLRKTKSAALRDMVMQPGGASLQSLMTATGWQSHTVRAALSGLRKAGADLIRTPSACGPVYSIATASTATPVCVATAAAVKPRPQKKAQRMIAADPEVGTTLDNSKLPPTAVDATAVKPDTTADAAPTPAVAL